VEKKGIGISVDIAATEEQLALLAGKVPGPYSLLSPLGVLRKKYDTGSLPAGLPGAFVDGEGELRADAARVLNVLATAGSFGSIRFAGRGLAFETAVYFGGNGSEPGVSLTNRGDELRIQSPPAGEAAAEMMSLQTGESLLRRIDLETELSLQDGAVLLACLDAVRRNELTRIVEGSADGGYLVSSVERSLQARDVGMQWLAPLFHRANKVPPLNGAAIRESLTSLLRKGLVKKDRGGWKPAPVLRQAAAELLLIDAHARLRQAGGLDGKTAAASDLRVVQGRSGAFLLWTADRETVSFSGASAAQVVIMTRSAMMAPGADEAGNGEAGPAGTATCFACGATVLRGDRFCAGCGRNLEG
jgi:hypothetical protein